MASFRKYSGKHGDTYEIRVSCGYDVRGKQMLKRKTWKPDPLMTTKQIEKELQRQIILFEEECKGGKINSSIKFETFAERWFEEYGKPDLRPTTYERDKQLKGRIYPALGHLKLDKVTHRDIKLFINDLTENERNIQTGKPLAYKTIQHYLSLLSRIFNYAIECDLISNNPCKNVKIPKSAKNRVKTRTLYTLDELKQLFGYMSKDAPLKYYLMFLLLFYTGFRRGELLGLEWKDIDWDNRIISVRRCSAYTSENGIHTSDTKTEKSKRSNRYPEELFVLLNKYKQEQDKERIKQGTQWHDYDRLFTKEHGEPMNLQTPYGWLKKYCETHNMRFCNIHSFRHLHATVLIAAGVDVAKVSADLGHSNNLTTLGIYIHEFELKEARLSDIMESAIKSQLNLGI